LIGVVVDIDDTLINTEHRMQAVWQELLGHKIPMQAVRTLSNEQLFLKYASPDQKTRASEYQKRFWDIVLCLEEIGTELLKLDKPIPFAADILQKWSKQCALVYLTGRTENTRSLTINELKKFGFPTENTQLKMFNPRDYTRTRGENPSGPTLVDAKARLFASIAKQHTVVRVVDDYPSYFQVYKQFNVPDRIGLLRSERYPPERYIDEGATRVIETWQKLQNDPPRPP
jgi:predicted secreted acid phosphatase